jgi:hypothetical protein
MFKVGDILKTRMDVAESVYEGCRGTTVYETMMELARTKRFEVIGDQPGIYVIKHLDVDPPVELHSNKNEVHAHFERDDEYVKQS